MKKLSILFILFLLISCTNNEKVNVEIFTEGAKISGVNGIHFGPDGYLYATSVIGSDISIVDTDNKTIVKRYGPKEGVFGPDDVAFNEKGEFYWTSILTGEVAGFNIQGEKVIAANLGPGVNPITFSDDGRLFVAQCFFGDGLYEVDPYGIKEPRSLKEDLGPNCGLNGMDWGPDGKLYGPRWFNNEVVSIDVDTGEMNVVVKGLNVPAAVKFNSKGVLHVLDTADGKVLKIIDGQLEVVASLLTGLDNFDFNSKDEIFVSSYADGSILKVTDNNIVEILPGGISHPGGLAISQNNLVVADIQSVRAFNLSTKEEDWVLRNIFRSSPLGASTSAASLDNNIILTSWLDNTVKILDPSNGQIIKSFEGLNIPISTTKFDGHYAVALHGNTSISLLKEDGTLKILSDEFDSPTHVINYKDRLLVSDRNRGELITVSAEGDTSTLISGLDSPEGIAVINDTIFVYEGDTGEVKSIFDNKISVIANLSAGSPAASPLQPPSMVFNGIVAHKEKIYATDEMKRSIYIISP
tara:strand:+ start:974 stop:2548 length:1575 start_codon:yes stop_codon:yes gene_type:complete